MYDGFANVPVDDLFLRSSSIEVDHHIALTAATTTEGEAESSNTVLQSDESRVKAIYTTHGMDGIVDQDDETEVDEFAELDAWFASGAVEII
jgi:hypothetical protein